MTNVSMEALMLEEQGLGGEEQAGGVKSSERRSLNEAWEQLKERFWTAATHMQIQGADTGDSSQLSRPAKLILACFLLFIGLLLVVGSQGDGESPYSTTSGCTLNDHQYDYFQLVVQWPPNFGSKTGRSIDYWTIHGLWPSRTSLTNTYPCDCTQEKFNVDQIQTIESNMKKYWPTLKDGSSHSSFWAHEWEKHGTCSGPFLESQLKYFKTTVDLRTRYDPALLLAQARIEPSSEGHPFDKIYGALSKNGIPVLRCRQNGSVQYLSEVGFCITASELLVQFHCPTAVTRESNCKLDLPIVLAPVSKASG